MVLKLRLWLLLWPATTKKDLLVHQAESLQHYKTDGNCIEWYVPFCFDASITVTISSSSLVFVAVVNNGRSLVILCGIKIHIYSQYLRCVSLTYLLSILKAETYNIGVFSWVVQRDSFANLQSQFCWSSIKIKRPCSSLKKEHFLQQSFHLVFHRDGDSPSNLLEKVLSGM